MSDELDYRARIQGTTMKVASVCLDQASTYPIPVGAGLSRQGAQATDAKP